MSGNDDGARPKIEVPSKSKFVAKLTEPGKKGKRSRSKNNDDRSAETTKGQEKKGKKARMKARKKEKRRQKMATKKGGKKAG